MNQLHIKKGQPYPLGASSIRSNAINFSMVNNSQDDCGIILYDKETQTQKRIPFDSSHRLGNICCMTIEGLTAEQCPLGYIIPEQPRLCQATRPGFPFTFCVDISLSAKTFVDLTEL